MPRQRYTYSDYIKNKNKAIDTAKANIRLSRESIDKIKRHPSTVRLHYEDYPDAFDYVGNLFPSVDLLEVEAYKCSHKYLSKLENKSANGFFSTIEKVIVIKDKLDTSPEEVKKAFFVSEMTIDEVLVHEMLHYVSDKINSISRSTQVEEEFALRNSIGYLKGFKNHSDKSIIDKHFMPYLAGTLDHKKIYTTVFLRHNVIKKSIYEIGKEEMRKYIKMYKDEIVDILYKQAYPIGERIIAMSYEEMTDCEPLEKFGRKPIDIDLS